MYRTINYIDIYIYSRSDLDEKCMNFSNPLFVQVRKNKKDTSCAANHVDVMCLQNLELLAQRN